MREKFWRLYEHILYNERYYWHYRQRSIKYDRIIKAVLVLASLSGFAGLWLWQSIPKIWSIIAFVAQAISACAYLLPHSDQITAIDHLSPELSDLLVRMVHDWNTIDSLSQEEINDLILKYEREFNALEEKYTHGISFPRRHWVKHNAQKDWMNTLYTRHSLTKFESLKEAQKNDRKKTCPVK